MTDVLLIQPPVRDFYLTAKRTIPYGLISIAAVLIKNGFSVDIFDALATSRSHGIAIPKEMAYLEDYYAIPDKSPFALFHQFKYFGYSLEHIGKIAAASGAFLVGISSLFTAYCNDALMTAQIVKNFLPHCKVVLGGHHPTALPKSVMECEAVDFVIRGEGEVSMPLLANAIKTGAEIDSIPGIVFRKKDKTIQINNPAMMENLDAYPLPAINLIKHSYYKRGKHGSMVVTASRGCPMKCSYCCVGYSIKYRRRSIDAVLAEIENAVNQYNVRFIDFEDENLSLDREWFLTLLHEIKRRFGLLELELRAMNGLFPPSLDEDIIRAMKDAGFKILNLSVGAASSLQLKKFNRPDVRESLETVLTLAEIYGMGAVCYIIAGAPGQKAEDSISDLLYLAKRNCLVGVSIFYPAPGSPDYKLCEEMAILPEYFSLMRSSALPISHTTTRNEAVTILRLARILNFIKSLKDDGESIPEPEPFITGKFTTLHNRREIGKQILKWFLHDSKIRGVTPGGDIFEYPVSTKLVEQFFKGLNKTTLASTQQKNTC